MPDPETEVASDDQRSVHTESAEDSDSSADDEEDEQGAHDEQDSDDSAGHPQAKPGASSGVCRAVREA